MKNIIVTGGIGTGKSYVTKLLAEKLKADVINFDQEWHKMLNDPSAKKDIIDLFGNFILDNDLNIDRKKLGNIVFSSKSAMGKYMRIIHRHIDIMTLNILRNINDNHNLTIIEVPVAFEAIPMDYLFQSSQFLFVGVFASKETQIRRVVTRSKYSINALEAAQRIDFQPSPSEYMHRCDICFWNEDGSPIDELVDSINAKLCREI